MKQVSILAVAFVIGLNAYATTQTDTIATQTTVRTIDHKVISGTVTDRKGQPVIGATVKVKEDVRKNAVTDIDGNFKISDIPDSCTLQVSYIGFMPMETKVTPDKSEYVISDIVYIYNYELTDITFKSKIMAGSTLNYETTVSSVFEDADLYNKNALNSYDNP